MIKKQPVFPARSYRSRESGTVSAAATTTTGESRGRRFSRFGPCLFALWKRTAAAEPPPEGTGRGGGKENGGSAAPPKRSKGPKGDSPRPRPGAQKPRGRATDNRAEDGRGTGNRPAAAANGAARKGAPGGRPRGRRSGPVPNDTLRPPRAAAPRAAANTRRTEVRKKAGGRKLGPRPGGGTEQATGDPTAWAGSQSAVVPRRMLGAGITAARAHSSAVAPAQPDRAEGFAPMGWMSVVVMGAVATEGSTATGTPSAAATPDEGVSPARQPERATGRPNGAAVRTGYGVGGTRAAGGAKPFLSGARQRGAVLRPPAASRRTERSGGVRRSST